MQHPLHVMQSCIINAVVNNTMYQRGVDLSHWLSTTGSAGSEQHHAGAHSASDRPSTQYSGEGTQRHSDRQGQCGWTGHSLSADGQRGALLQAGAEAGPRHRDRGRGPKPTWKPQLEVWWRASAEKTKQQQCQRVWKQCSVLRKNCSVWRWDWTAAKTIYIVEDILCRYSVV